MKNVFLTAIETVATILKTIGATFLDITSALANVFSAEIHAIAVNSPGTSARRLKHRRYVVDFFNDPVGTVAQVLKDIGYLAAEDIAGVFAQFVRRSRDADRSSAQGHRLPRRLDVAKAVINHFAATIQQVAQFLKDAGYLAHSTSPKRHGQRLLGVRPTSSLRS